MKNNSENNEGSNSISVIYVAIGVALLLWPALLIKAISESLTKFGIETTPQNIGLGWVTLCLVMVLSFAIVVAISGSIRKKK